MLDESRLSHYGGRKAMAMANLSILGFSAMALWAYEMPVGSS